MAVFTFHMVSRLVLLKLIGQCNAAFVIQVSRC